MIFRKALEAKPNHPEIMSILAEVSGLGDNFVLMEETITRAKGYYDNLSQNHLLDTKTLASYYHKLSNAYIAVSLIPLLSSSFYLYACFSLERILFKSRFNFGSIFINGSFFHPFFKGLYSYDDRTTRKRGCRESIFES